MSLKFVGTLRLILYWALPPLIIYIIFNKIDMQSLVSLTVKANINLIITGASLILLKICLGGLRWHLLSKKLACTKLNFNDNLAEYWISLTLGVIGLGSLGSDAYRIALSGKQTGHYVRGGVTIGIEKISALFSCAALITGVYPLLHFDNLPSIIVYVLNFSYYFLIGCAPVFIFIFTTHKTEWYAKFETKISNAILNTVNKIKRKIKAKPTQDSNIDQVSESLPRLIFRLNVLLPALLISFIIHIVSAIQSQLFFQSLGYELPFLVNIFISPLILLVFALPISFGSLGIREGAYILFYGAFGVPAEIALLVSFCGLFCVLVGHAIGLVFIVTRRRKNTMI